MVRSQEGSRFAGDGFDGIGVAPTAIRCRRSRVDDGRIVRSLALCLHDESRGVGGLLHLRFIDGTGSPTDVTDNTLSSVLVVLDRFTRAVIGNPRGAMRFTRAYSPCAAAHGRLEPTATLVDLIRADLADGKIACEPR